MAIPANPLDKYTTYTYHFELYASSDWDELLDVAGGPTASELSTTRRESNGPLLINTRKDAHTTIDHVNFSLLSTFNSITPLLPQGDLSMVVTEPGGIFFAEKVRNHMIKYNVSESNSIIYGLKIIFVGRTPDNRVDVIADQPLIPLILFNMEAKFDIKGGVYSLIFNNTGSVLSKPVNGRIFQTTEIMLLAGRINKNVSINASSVGEAIKQLEDKVNSFYEKIYSTEVDDGALENGQRKARPIKYKFTYDPEVDGSLKLVDKGQLTFNPKASIPEILSKIFMSSPEVLEMLKESQKNVGKAFHPGVKIPIITPHYYPTADAINITYHVGVYKGDGKPNEDNSFTFNYMFTGGGANVDVLDFEIKFQMLQNWLSQSSSYGVHVNTLLDKSAIEDPEWKKYVATNVIHPDTTRNRLENLAIEKKKVWEAQNDGAFLPLDSKGESRGLVGTAYGNAGSSRLAFNTIVQMNASTETELTFSIRGHLKMLQLFVIDPELASQPVGGYTKPLWIKVNIKDMFGDDFYYTGWYILSHVQNVFSDGRFTQQLTVMMVPPEDENQQPPEQ